ncbi:MAG TPA: cytochrome c [Thermodesulfobacteriota bacterium]|nr:cytochrome c [Thermodesulfobacteriota bacterium]
MKKLTILVSLSLIFSILLSIAVESELRAAQGSLDNGKMIFETKCSPCHTIGGGKRVGPDLKGVTEQRSRDWLVQFISNPEKMFQAGDPIAKDLLAEFGGIKMPDLGLSQQEAFNVLSYIGPQQPSPEVAPQEGQIQATIVGDPLRGERLFTGAVLFQNGGPPCMSCHNVSEISFPGGGTLGPDLTAAYPRLGPATMNSALATLPFPTMTPLFDKRPLTLAEQHDLKAFFEKASTRPLTNMTIKIILSVIGGFIILMVLIWRIWPKRLPTVRKSLVEQAVENGGARL